MSKRRPRENITARYHAGDLDEDQDQIDSKQRFSARSKNAQKDKMVATALLRAEEGGLPEAQLAALPVGQVVQVFSLFSEVEHAGRTILCVVRKTLQKLAGTNIVVGDRVKFRETEALDETGKPQGVIEQVLPRNTILTRAAGKHDQQPIVANADQMLIVASIVEPVVKWGLIDRMIIAAQSGKLVPIICLNKMDLAAEVVSILQHYRSLGIATLTTSIKSRHGLVELQEILRGKSTVLSGHSGVGKSSLIRALQPHLDLRIGEVSAYTSKGRHTTTSARRYKLDFGGEVIDTPGVKIFGLYNVTRENLIDFFPDVAGQTAPQWRVESYERIAESLTG